MDEEWLNTVGSSNGIGEEMGRCYIRTWRDWDLGLELGVCVGRWASIRNWKRSRAPVDLGGSLPVAIVPVPVPKPVPLPVSVSWSVSAPSARLGRCACTDLGRGESVLTSWWGVIAVSRKIAHKTQVDR